MSCSRRRFLAAGASITTLLAGAGLAGCAATGPSASALAPGVTRVRLGDLTITMLSDGFFSPRFDENFVRNAPFAAVQAALRDAGLPTDRLEIPLSPLVVETGSQRILFDTGMGEFGPPTTGRALGNLTRAGIDPSSITAVAITHFHGDHINGLRNKAGALVFPNAKLYVPAPEWDWWMDDRRMAAAPDAMKGQFANVRRVFGPIAASVVRFRPGDTVLPGLQSVPAFGHTPGHTAFTMKGGGRTFMYWGDTTNVPALFVRNPDWAVMFDMDAEAARQTRRRLADLVVRENMLLAGFHLDGSAIGHLSTRGSGYAFTALRG